MKSIFALTAAALLAVPAVAFADEAPKESFSYKGVDYTYTTQTVGNARVLRGTADNGRTPFELRITKSGVTGTFGEEAVSFPLREVKHLEATDLASR